MKRITIAMCLLISLVAAGAASAQDHATKATVPFGFYVGNAWVPAGDYTLTSDAGSPVVAIRGSNGKSAMLGLTRRESAPARSNVLVFAKYGEKYFLHEVHFSHGVNLALSRSKTEKRAETQEASMAPASTVYLALR